MRRYNDPLTQVLHLFSPLRHMSSPIVVRDDLLIETDVGCFSIAYSPETNTAALFYAKDPDSFASTVKEDGTREYLHKERMSFVNLYPVFHDPKQKWDHNDARMQFDFTRIKEDINWIIDELPRAQIRETCLHRTGKHESASVFIATRVVPSATVPGEFNVYLSTKSNENYRLLENGHEEGQEKPGTNKIIAGITRAFKNAGHHMVRHGFASEFMLRAVDAYGNEKTSFTLKELPEVIETNFSKMQAQIKEGIDPIHLKDQAIWPALRAGSYISNKIEEITEEARHDPGALAIKFGVMAFDFVKDFGISAIGKAVVEVLGEASAKEHVHKLPPEWHKLIKSNGRRFVSMKSVMHELLAQPDPEEFKDLSPISSDKHICNFAHSSAHLRPATPTSTFNRLLRGMLLAPYDSTFEYRGDKHVLVNPANLDQVKTVHMYAANGIVLHYIPKTKHLYAYYHKPTHVMPNHHLHSRAHEFFTEGHVLRIDASQPDTFIHRMSFRKFEEEMRKHTGKPDLALPSADQPEKPPVAIPGQPRNDNKPIISYLGIA